MAEKGVGLLCKGVLYGGFDGVLSLAMVHRPRKSASIILILAAKEEIPLSLYFDWVRPFVLQWILKSFLALGGTDGFLWMKQQSTGSYRPPSMENGIFVTNDLKSILV